MSHNWFLYHYPVSSFCGYILVGCILCNIPAFLVPTVLLREFVSRPACHSRWRFDRARHVTYFCKKTEASLGTNPHFPVLHCELSHCIRRMDQPRTDHRHLSDLICCNQGLFHCCSYGIWLNIISLSHITSYTMLVGYPRRSPRERSSCSL